ncbi:MAG: FtsX-like permease family protein [Clostridiales bacterium]|jgi:hypothetical protein|nr:FtsX-like permease family protein [Clostridiales bacterium]
MGRTYPKKRQKIQDAAAAHLQSEYPDGYIEIFRLNGYDFPSAFAGSSADSVKSLGGVYEIDENTLETMGFSLMDLADKPNIFAGYLPMPDGGAASPNASFFETLDISKPLPADAHLIPELQNITGINFASNFGELLYLLGYFEPTLSLDSRFPLTGSPVAGSGYGEELNEVVITDFLAYVIIRQLAEALPPQYGFSIPSGGDALKAFLNGGFEASLVRYFNVINAADRSSNLRITGVIDTGYKEKFFDYLNVSTATLSAEYLKYVYYAENYYLMLYSGGGFAKSCYKDRLVTNLYHYSTANDGILPAYLASNSVKFADNYHYSGQPNSKEIIMTENAFRYEFGFDFAARPEIYYINKSVDNVDLNGYKVVGVIDNSTTENLFKTSFGIIVAQSDFEYLIDSLSYRIGIRMSIKNSEAYALFDFMEDNLLCYASVYSTITFRAAPTIKNLRSVFLPIAAIIALISVVTLAMFLITAVTKKQKDIGVMKALGMKTRDVIKVYLIESAFTLLSVLIFSSIAVYLFFAAADSILTHDLQRYLQGELVKQITVLYITAMPFVINAAAIILIGIASIIYPTVKISKMSPAEAIRKDL